MHKIRQPPLKFHYMHFGEKHMHFSILQHALLHPARDKIGIDSEVAKDRNSVTKESSQKIPTYYIAPKRTPPNCQDGRYSA